MEVLKVLQKSYYGKVKMIYIDPPYNTGNDSFIYPDKFSETKEEYLKRIGDKDDDGFMMKEGLFRKNNKENGQFHSNWLNMMLPRLFLARNLLKDDGVIFVSIDDNEQANLKLLMDEVFGEENFVGQWNWFRSATPPNLSKKIKKNIEYVLCYHKGNNDDKFKGVKKVSSSDDPFTKPQNTLKELRFEI
ncbi:site-specific DNA-methyltransferase [Flectobacillus sp. DC10W]|uniref:site-specific DNA-methyltransferase (adenine-specific) n=1 Tax=Flectobacillus longus TaxID=2984207 RepID=A0ABT6YVJ2_9BACT|nr:site-specific DNA-methyltransferase [Flectobacillus longus]MDI9867605.1 site-specific DNA-methyltransferase [Flectobacillus longus]